MFGDTKELLLTNWVLEVEHDNRKKQESLKRAVLLFYFRESLHLVTVLTEDYISALHAYIISGSGIPSGSYLKMVAYFLTK